MTMREEEERNSGPIPESNNERGEDHVGILVVDSSGKAEVADLGV